LFRFINRYKNKTKKPSAVGIPVNHLGSMILIGSTQYFTAGIVLGKLTESVSLRPFF
jgi:hypothetical protein